MVEVKTLACWDTEFSADSVEWCPVDPFRHMFVCGTYQLVEGERHTSASRKGRLHLFAFTNSDKVITSVEGIDMPAVLDCQWAPRLVHEDVLLAIANASGQICIFRLLLGDDSQSERLVELTKTDLQREADEPELLALAVDWRVSDDSCVRLAASDSRGRISVLRLDHIGLHLESNWTAHQFEAWTVHFDPFNHNICYTGGDDCKLKKYDVRADYALEVCTSRAHSAGVTSFCSKHNTEHSLLSGSYDEQVLMWDSRKMSRPVTSTASGGGVWRLRWKPGTEDLLLAACMYNGFHLFDSELQALVHYSEHESIAYGAGWTHLTEGMFPDLLSPNNTLMATCSFYDHKLCLSLVEGIKRERKLHNIQ